MAKNTISDLRSQADGIVANGNNVSIRDVIFSILAFNHKSPDKYPCIVMFDDGSVVVIDPQTDDVIDNFHNLEEFVKTGLGIAENSED